MGYLPAKNTSKISWVDVLYYQSKYYFVYVHAYTADKIIEHILEGFLEFAVRGACILMRPRLGFGLFMTRALTRGEWV